MYKALYAPIKDFDPIATTEYALLLNPIVDRLSDEVAKYLALPAFRETLVSQGLTPYVATPAQYAALLQEGYATNAGVIKKANIKFEN